MVLVRVGCSQVAYTVLMAFWLRSGSSTVMTSTSTVSSLREREGRGEAGADQR